MPKHDFPDDPAAPSNVFDFRDYLERRDRQTAEDKEVRQEPSLWEIYRHAEGSDGKRLRFGRYDLIWLAMLAIAGWVAWMAIR